MGLLSSKLSKSWNRLISSASSRQELSDEINIADTDNEGIAIADSAT